MRGEVVVSAPVVAVVTAANLLGAPPADLARSKDRVEMTARGGIEVDLDKQVGTAKGDVVIRRADVTVCCDEARAHYRDGRIVRLSCRGRVVIRRVDGTRATADEALFVADRDALTLTGRVRLQTKDATLSGPRVVYDIRQDRLNVMGAKSRFEFRPGAPVQGANPRSCPVPRDGR